MSNSRVSFEDPRAVALSKPLEGLQPAEKQWIGSILGTVLYGDEIDYGVELIKALSLMYDYTGSKTVSDVLEQVQAEHNRIKQEEELLSIIDDASDSIKGIMNESRRNV